MRASLKIILPAALAAGMLVGCGLTAPRSSDGFANLDSLGVFDVDNTMTLSIGPTLLRFAALHVDDDPEVRTMLRNLDGVRIRIYEIDGNAERVAGRVDRMSEKLRDDDWESLATIQEDGERVHLMIKNNGERIVGMTVITADTSEAVVINLMGDIQPELFTPAMAALDVDAPDVKLAKN